MDVSDDTVYKAYLTAYRGSYVPPLSAKHLAAAAIADKDREEKREPRTGAQVVAWVAALFDVGGAPTSGQTDAATDASNLAGLLTVIDPPGERKTPNPLLGKRHAFAEADAARRARDGHSVPEVRPGDILRLKPHLGRGEVMVVCDTIAGRAVRLATATGAPQLVGMMTTEVVYGAYDIVWALDTPVSFQFAHGWWLATTKGCADPVRVALDIEEAVAAADAARKEGDCRSLRTLLDISVALVALALRNDAAAGSTAPVPSTPAAPNPLMVPASQALLSWLPRDVDGPAHGAVARLLELRGTREGVPPTSGAIENGMDVIAWLAEAGFVPSDVSADVLGGVALWFVPTSARRDDTRYVWISCMNDGSSAVVYDGSRGVDGRPFTKGEVAKIKEFLEEEP